MPIDPNSITPGKCYVTLTKHLRTVLEVTNDRVRFAYGGGDAGGISPWRWQTKDKFANDAVGEVASEVASASTPAFAKTEKKDSEDAAGSDEPRPPGSRKILSKRR